LVLSFCCHNILYCTVSQHNYLNIEEIYEEIYQNLCIAGHACEHPKPLWRDKNGNAVESKENAFGLKSKYELINPDWLIFVDECGSIPCRQRMDKPGGRFTFALLIDGLNNGLQLKTPISLFCDLPLLMGRQ
jgi:hypothetical protein